MDHSHQSLAHNRTCQIEYCPECEVMHLTIGPVTLRLQPSAGHQLCSALVEALERLPSRAPTSLRPVLEPRLPS
ncbi:MAG: hypothetical protein KC501_07920 [Myxococcales bacterium]|nr:hypothetical protein [Myxococcales bacterium]